MRFTICLTVCIIILLGTTVSAEKYFGEELPVPHIFENPKPTCEEKVFAELKKVAELDEDMSDQAFLVKPWSIVADAEGNIFVMDAMFRKIYKYDKNLKFIRSFGGKGEGPGEFSTSRGGGSGFIQLYLGRDNLIYAGDRVRRKIVCFDRDGKLVKEFRLNVAPFTMMHSVQDSKGNFYLCAFRQKHAIDVLNRQGDRITGILPRKKLARGLFHRLKRPANVSGFYGDSGTSTIAFDILSDDRLLIGLKNSGFFYIYRNGKILNEIKLWPKKALKWYKNDLFNAIHGAGSKWEGFISFFHYVYIDKDDEKSFYCHYGKPDGADKTFIYQFDFDGNLLKVIYLKEPFKQSYTRVLYKRNGLFYAYAADRDHNYTLKIFKVEVKK